MNLFRLVCGLFVMFTSISQVYASDIPEEIAIRILVGEAGNQGLKGMVCVGEVLRNRGSAKGFKGYKFIKTKKEPKSLWDKARKAWMQSAYTHYTKGADHFANIRQFKKPSWVKHCVKVYEYKDHVFYKEIKRRKK